VLKLALTLTNVDVRDLVYEVIEGLRNFNDMKLLSYDRIMESSAIVRVKDVDVNVFGNVRDSVARVDITRYCTDLITDYYPLTNILRAVVTLKPLSKARLNSVELSAASEAYLPLRTAGVNKITSFLRKLLEEGGVAINSMGVEKVADTAIITANGLYPVANLGVFTLIYVGIVRYSAIRMGLTLFKRYERPEDLNENTIKAVAMEVFTLGNLIADKINTL